LLLRNEAQGFLGSTGVPIAGVRLGGALLAALPALRQSPAFKPHIYIRQPRQPAEDYPGYSQHSMKKLASLIKIFGYIDYAVSGGVLIYGVGTASWLYIAAGALGVVIAYMKPAERLQTVLQSKFIRKPAQAATLVPHTSVQKQDGSTYAARSRYARTGYFVGYFLPIGSSREAVFNPRNASALLAGAARISFGVRAQTIVPRDRVR
jgi:hypothetical protein